MNDIGNKLRQARTEKNLSLEDISNRTRINQRYLESIERDFFDFLPLPYVIGFIKNYAEVVDLDADSLVEPLRIKHEQARAEAASPEAGELSEATMITPSEEAQKSESAGSGHQDIKIPHLREISLGIGIVLIIMIMLFLVSKTNGEKSPPAPNSSSAANSQNSEGVATEQPFDEIAAEVKQKLSPPVTEKKAVEQNLVLRAVIEDSSWIRVVVDSTDTTDSIYSSGSSETWHGRIGFRIRIGNAGAVRLFLNGDELEQTGAFGQVADLYITGAGLVEKKISGAPRGRPNS